MNTKRNDLSTRAPALAGGSHSGFRPTGVVKGTTGLVPQSHHEVPVGLHLVSRIRSLEKDIAKKKRELAAVRKKLPATPVRDYQLLDLDDRGVLLSQLFGKHSELLVVHNMGPTCPYCTMWAHGFSGLYDYIKTKVGFSVVSKEEPKAQKAFYKTQEWTFPMYTSFGTTFRKDMGFETKTGDLIPGITAFVKENGKIYIVSSSVFGPRDNFCVIYDLFDLLPSGWKQWDEGLDFVR